jgi:predicted amidohydrolase
VKSLPVSPIEIAAIPLDLVWQDPRDNFEGMKQALERLPASKHPRIAVFPELTLTGFTTVNPADSALPASDPLLAEINALAAQFKTALVYGYPERMESGAIRNALVFVGPNGRELGRYHKLHLFTQGATPETSTYQPGERPVTVDYEGWRLGLGICFDLRFPELFRAYSVAGCDVNLLSACWVGGATKSDQFKAMAKGQATLSQSFMVALNRTGKDPFCTFDGETLAYGPRAEVICESAGSSAVFELDPQLLRAARILDVRSSLKDRYQA